MLKLIPILIFICCSGLVYSQSNFMNDSIIYMTLEDEAFMRDKDTKFLFKFGQDLGAEFKVSKSLALTAELVPDFLNSRVNSSFVLGAAGGAKYYYKMASRIKAGKQANNMSGEYLGLRAGIGVGIVETEMDSLEFGSAKGYSFSIGNQQRYLNYQYFDYSLNVDYNYITTEDDIEFSTLTLRTESSYGFVLGKRHDLDKSALCPVIKCYEDRKSGFKINRNNFFALSRSTNNKNADIRWRLDLNPRIGYERKIGSSPFSIAQDLRASFRFINYDDNMVSSFGIDRTSYSYSLSGRYYLNMAKKILAGEQGNNLTGGYLQAMFRHKYISTAADKNSGSILVGIGRQNEVVDNLYMDFSFSLGVQVYNGLEMDGDLDFTIGYMF